MENNNNPLKKYQKRIFIESIIKSIIYGAIAGFAVVGIVSLILYMFGTKNVIASIILGVVSGIGSAIYVYKTKFAPTLNNVAKRIDSLGLNERVVTMVEYADSESVVCVKQREDTQERLSHIDTKSIKFRIPKLSLALLGILALLASSSLFLPNRNNGVNANLGNSSSGMISSSQNSMTSSSSSTLTPEDIDEIIRQMIEEIRKIINNADISDASKDILHEIVDDLENRVFATDDISEKISMINETRQEIRHKIELMKSVAKCLQEDPTTSKLGIAIANATGLKDTVEIANIITEGMDGLIEDLNNSEDKEAFIEDLKKSLEFSLGMATEEENEALMTALSSFLDRLNGVDDPNGSDDNTGENPETPGNGSVDFRRHAIRVNLLASGASAIEESKQEIIDALMPPPEDQPKPDEPHDPTDPDQGEEPTEPEDPQDPQDPSDPSDPNEGQDPSEPQEPQDPSEDQNQGMDETGDQIDDAIQDAIDKIPAQDPNQGQTPDDGNQGNEGGGEPSDDDNPPPPIFDDGTLDSETIIDGIKQYGDYYKEYADAIKEYLATHDDIPEDVKEKILKYLEMLQLEAEENN